MLCRRNLICNIQVKSAKFNPFNILQGKITFIITGDECKRVRPPCRLYSQENSFQAIFSFLTDFVTKRDVEIYVEDNDAYKTF